MLPGGMRLIGVNDRSFYDGVEENEAHVSCNIPGGMKRARVCVPRQIMDGKQTFRLKPGVLGMHTPKHIPWCIMFVKPGKNLVF